MKANIASGVTLVWACSSQERKPPEPTEHRFIPGSHLWGETRCPDKDLSFYAELEPGNAFIMLCSCYQGGSANTTVDEERLVTVAL